MSKASMFIFAVLVLYALSTMSWVSEGSLLRWILLGAAVGALFGRASRL